MRLSLLQAAIQASAAAVLPVAVSASSNGSKSKHRHLHIHKHGHGHRDSHIEKPADSHTEKEVTGEELRRRDIVTAPVPVTHVTQTVSVVQVIDGQGSVVSISTVPPPSTTPADTTATTSTPVSSAPLSDSISTQPGTSAAAGASGASTEPSATSPSVVAGVSSSPITSGATASAVAAPTTARGSSIFVNGTLTSSPAPMTTSPAPMTTVATSTRIFGNGTSTSTSHSLSVNHTQTSSLVFSSFASSTSSFLSSSSAVSSSVYSSSLYTSVTGTSSAASAESTGSADSTSSTGGVVVGGTATSSGAGAAPTSSSDDDSSSTPTGVVVGSVVGGLAGIALLLVIALYLIKWKRKKADGSRLLKDGDNAAGTAGIAKGVAGGPGGSGGFGGLGTLGLTTGMTEPRGGFLAPFASALASGQRRLSRAAESTMRPALAASGASMGGGGNGGPDTRAMTGGLVTTTAVPTAMDAGSCSPILESPTSGHITPPNPSSPVVPSDSTPSPATERSFYRVSGRKLPSVLQHGGDGYEDPRQSVMSTTTVNTAYTHMSMQRDSRGFFGGAGGPSTTPMSRYAVGTPMRPESGVPVFHTGPGKTASPMRAPASRQGSFVQDDGASIDVPGRNLTPPPGPGHLDPVGRSLISQDGSRGSRGSISRFTEEIH